MEVYILCRGVYNYMEVYILCRSVYSEVLEVYNIICRCTYYMNVYFPTTTNKDISEMVKTHKKSRYCEWYITAYIIKKL